MSNNCSPNVQAVLDNLYEIGRYEAPAGALEMAFSDANGAAIQAQMINANGKYSNYSITYAKGNCDAVVACDDFDCADAPQDAGPLTGCINFDSFDCLAMPKWKAIPISSLRDLGSMDNRSVVAAHLWDQMQKMRAAIDEAYVQWLCTEKGCFATGVDSKTLNLMNALGAPNFEVDTDILADFGDAGFGSINPILLGNRQAMKFAKAQNASGAAASGLMLNDMTRFPVYYDKNIVSDNCAPATAGNEVMFALLPGISNIITWSKNSGLFASRASQIDYQNVELTDLIRAGETFLHTQIADPRTGMLFDLDVIYEPKCQEWMYAMRTYYKFINLPLTGCKDTCFNGIVAYDVCPATPAPCVGA